MKSIVIVSSVFVAIVGTAFILANLTSGDSQEPVIFTDAATVSAGIPSPTPFVFSTPTGLPPTATPTISSGAPVRTFFPTISLSMNIGDSGRYVLSDGSSRTIRLLDTELIYSQQGTTIWATATIEVSGPDLEPVVKEIAVSYLREPEVIYDVRIWADITNHFQPRELRDQGGTMNDVRLVLSDARLPMTDLDKFIWPFPDIVWQEGSRTTYHQGVQGTFGQDMFHHGAMDFGLPRGTPVYAWGNGPLTITDRGFDFVSTLETFGDGLRRRIDLLHLEEGFVDLHDSIVEPGTLIGYSGEANWYHVHMTYGFDLAPIMAEWYIKDASPERLSFVQEWITAGPYYNDDDATRLSQDYLGDESTVMPSMGDAAAESREWYYFDNLVPGVVYPAETVSPFPFSGWAEASGNYNNGAIYMATYAESSTEQEVELNVGASDAIAVWINDELVLQEDRCIPAGGERAGETPTIVIDEFRVPVTLQAGSNKILVKTAQRDGCPRTWQVALRFLNLDGTAVEDLVFDALQGEAKPESQARPDERKLILSGIDPATLGQPEEDPAQVSIAEQDPGEIGQSAG